MRGCLTYARISRKNLKSPRSSTVLTLTTLAGFVRTDVRTRRDRCQEILAAPHGCTAAKATQHGHARIETSRRRSGRLAVPRLLGPGGAAVGPSNHNSHAACVPDGVHD